MDRFHSPDSIESMDWEGDQLTVCPSFILLPFCFLIHSPIHHSLHSPTNNPSKSTQLSLSYFP